VGAGVGATGLGKAGCGCAGEALDGMAIHQVDPDGNGEWVMGNGEWGMGNREWGIGPATWADIEVGPWGRCRESSVPVDNMGLSESPEASRVGQDESRLGVGCGHTGIRPRRGPLLNPGPQ
jgi:hypothetical protein